MLLAGAPLAAVCRAYDEMYGRPTPLQQRVLTEGCKQILQSDSWDGMFTSFGVEVPSNTEIATMLKNAVMTSLNLNYHKQGMDFEAVQKSGVSKILLKGEMTPYHTSPV